ncbi:antibiotic biosynthesis monooxygenase [Bacillus sp. 03113]|uniref:antibiotic biosynthesis monooxygenase family protein n=1 Tax=Bacillus sp. 03113 TaxID=2578211 RepID=UPI0015E882EC|nr:antibiotic biosynthesis monooxygenase [Bacillus sp. 03113]
MNLYITSGTYQYLEKIIKKHKESAWLLMENEDHALLLQETDKKTDLKAPRKYEAISSIGELTVKSGFAAMNHIPVTEEGRPIFEYDNKKKIELIKKECGLIALRLLRPLSSNTYIFLSIWENQHAYSDWKKASKFDIFFDQTKASTFLQESYIHEYVISMES